MPKWKEGDLPIIRDKQHSSEKNVANVLKSGAPLNKKLEKDKLPLWL